MVHRLAVRFSILALFAAAAGCGGYNLAASFRAPSGVSSLTSPKFENLKVKRIGVLPFRNESATPNAGKRMATIFYEGLVPSRQYEVQPPPPIDEDEDIRFEFRLRGGRKEGVRNEEQDNAWLKQKIDNFISTVQPYVTNLDLIYPGEYFEGKLTPAKKAPPKGTVARSSAAAAEEPGLDAYLTGVVTTYRNRSGNAFLGDKGSHVTYTAYLVSAKDGAILWKATFDEEQIYLLDNLLLLPRYAKHGFVWQTNDMLARSGLERVLATFPGLKKKIGETPGEN